MSDPKASHAGVLTAVRHVQSGQRDHAMRLLTESHTRDPSDFRVTHTLALMSLWQLVKRSSVVGRTGLADWRLCLGLWANLLADPRFWAWFAADADRRYRATVPATDVDAVRERLEQWLSETVTRCAGDNVAATLALEVRAARLMAVRGGIVPRNTQQPIPCGPILIQHLGLQNECRRLAADLVASRDEQTRRAAMYFSRLGTAIVHLDRGAPAAALACLDELWCSDCKRYGSKLSPAPRICRDTCSTFDELNLAFAHVKADRKRFRVAATTLTVEAHLQIARTALSGAELDVPTAREHWRTANRLPGSGELMHCQVHEFVLPRVRFFLKAARREDAIAVLQALPLSSATADDRVFGDAVRSLSQLLAARGVASANDNKLAYAQDDLRQAIKLNPASWSACRNLAVLLENAAAGFVTGQNPTSEDFRRAAELLTEARKHLKTFPGGNRAEINRMLGALSEHLAMVWNAQAVRAHERGDHDEASRIIDRALAELPGNPTLIQNRRVIRAVMRMRPTAHTRTTHTSHRYPRTRPVTHPAPPRRTRRTHGSLGRLIFVGMLVGVLAMVAIIGIAVLLNGWSWQVIRDALGFFGLLASLSLSELIPWGTARNDQSDRRDE